ncbi:uncharacterized protein LOC103310330 [Acyrthosiphon pisum]|uniref:DDE Tnp4 domain-containing protein n=1 Tax=Acyrthosiphon pisum TaxID=7029 RepID=A0A8R2B8I4_ACYPI|nr:uncharacterized protein LOC103310330 [Acyrthosiphon pisum]|eukprot:XP_008186496.1 PREDICTED: uncharacterized protein LOC103310330 [Acyrthosiphon pisum]
MLGGTFRFPEDSALPGSYIIVPHIIVSYEAFRLHKHIMKPFSRKASREDDSKKNFNYRLSRARRVTENAFGLLSQIFRVFYQPIYIQITTCDDLIWIACCLHNMLRDAYMGNNKRPFYVLDSEQIEPTNNMISMTRGGGFYTIEGF